MLKAYLVDDEIKALQLLQTYIQRIDFLEIVGSTRNPMTAFSYLLENEVDVLFLDINMPIMSGIELFKSLRHPPKVIFTTAYPEFAVEGFDLEALDYLVKPIPFPRFLKACERLLKQQQIISTEANEASNFNDLVYVKSGPTTHKISWRDVLYLEKDENYLIYHLPEKRILSRQTLSNLATIFPKYFCRIHKSYAVSLLHIDQMNRESLQLGKVELPIGRTYRQELLEQIRLFGE